MLMRSCRPMSPAEVEIFGDQHLHRGRTSKVQDHAVHVSLGQWREEWYTELRALMRKDGPTTALAMIKTIGEILELLHRVTQAPGRGFVRVVHLMTGDGIGTNDNAARRAYQHFYARYNKPGFRYFLIVWKCASHQETVFLLPRKVIYIQRI